MYIPESIIVEGLKLFEQGSSKTVVKDLIMENMGLGKTQSYERANIILGMFNDGARSYNYSEYSDEESENDYKEPNDKELEEDDLEFKDNYVYNKDSDIYVFLLGRTLGKNINLKGDVVRSLIKAYSNFDEEPYTINQVSSKFNIPRKYVIHILRALGITHDSTPVTDEEVSDSDVDQLAEEILQQKRFALDQKLNKIDWLNTKRDAKKWRELESGVFNPFKNFLEDYEAPVIKKINPPEHDYSNEVMVVGANDWQIGSKADEKYLVFGDEWNTEKALEKISDFAEKVVAKAKARNIGKLVIMFNGDIHHGFEGKTAKETELKCDTFRAEQFDATVKGISTFLGACASHFNQIKCKVVTGNHEGWTFYPVFRLMESMFASTEHVKFDIESKPLTHFMVNSTLFIMHHGASADYRAKIPNDDKGRVAYVQRIIRIAEKEGRYRNVDRVFFVKGDTHSFEAKDLGQFTFYTFGALPSGDEYADALALESTPCQNALVISKNKDYETIHFTF